jgi:hypothetical protein
LKGKITVKKLLSYVLCATILCIVSVPAFAAPATAWEDAVFAPQESGSDYVDGLFSNRGSLDAADLFSSTYAMSYVPNYVAPPALPPPPPVTYVDDDGSYCREYSRRTHIGNTVSESYGTACMQPDGSWRVVQ